MAENEVNEEKVFTPREPMVTQDLDGLECSNPNCENEHPLFLHATCHQDAGAAVSYQAGVMTMRCQQCSSLICKVKVATAEVQ
jgi:hypothetical protein